MMTCWSAVYRAASVPFLPHSNKDEMAKEYDDSDGSDDGGDDGW